MRCPKGPQARKSAKLMEKSPLLLLGSDRISHCLDNLAVTYVETRITETLKEGPCAGEVEVLPSVK